MNEMNAGGVRQRSVEVVVPVYNEAHVLADSVGRLHAYLEASFPFPIRITIADNASTDATWEAALALADRLPHVHAVRLDSKGRGRALKHAWSRSTADVVAYMDVDLSTGLEAFLPLVAPLLSGHSDLAVGSRPHRQADVVHGAKREFVSRSYNLLLKLGLAALPDLRRAVRLQGGPYGGLPGARAAHRGHRLVLRHRAPRPGPAQQTPHPRGARRLGRRPRQPRRHRPYGRRRPQGHGPHAAGDGQPPRPRRRRTPPVITPWVPAHHRTTPLTTASLPQGIKDMEYAS